MMNTKLISFFDNLRLFELVDLAAYGRDFDKLFFELETLCRNTFVQSFGITLVLSLIFIFGVRWGIIHARKKALAHLHERGLIKSSAPSQSFEDICFKLNLHQNAHHKREILQQGLNERYHYMASQALIIMNLPAKLTSETQGFQVTQDLYHIALESTVPLKRLVQGYPMPAYEESVSIKASLDTVQAIFLPEIRENAICIEITGDVESSFQADRIIFETLLHNLFKLCLYRTYKGGRITIDIKKTENVEIFFQDNGYDFEPTTQNNNDPLVAPDPLCMSKAQLQEFACLLDWTIEFDFLGRRLNNIHLSIPLQSSFEGENIVDMKQYKREKKR